MVLKLDNSGSGGMETGPLASQVESRSGIGDDAPPFSQRVPERQDQEPTRLPRGLLGVVAAGAIGLLVFAAAASRSSNDTEEQQSVLTPTTEEQAASGTEDLAGTELSERETPSGEADQGVDPVDLVSARPASNVVSQPPTQTSPPPPTAKTTRSGETSTTTESTTTTSITTSTTTTTPPVPVNLIVNPGLEAAVVPDGASATVDLSGWVTSRPGNVIEMWGLGHSGVSPSQGRQLVELNGTGPDSIGQTLTVEAGQTYRWSIDHQGRRVTETIEVLIDGQSQGRFSASTGSWVTHSGDFVAGAAEITITFRALDAGSVGNLVDNVRLLVVPQT